jgi:uncharacterized membrane protein YhaH (DUF805 family)
MLGGTQPNWLNDYTSFQGRLRRGQALVRHAATLLLVLPPTVLLSLLFEVVGWRDGPPLLLSLIFALVTYPTSSLIVRRFHDVGISGWWAAPYVALLALMCALPARLYFTLWFSPALIAVQVAVGLFSFAIVLCPGAKGENRFGPPPQPSVLDRGLGKFLGVRFA